MTKTIFVNKKNPAYPTIEATLDSVRTMETDTAIMRGQIAASRQNEWNEGKEWKQKLTIPTLLKETDIPTKAALYGPGKWKLSINCDMNAVSGAIKTANQKHNRLVKVRAT